MKRLLRKALHKTRVISGSLVMFFILFIAVYLFDILYFPVDSNNTLIMPDWCIILTVCIPILGAVVFGRYLDTHEWRGKKKTLRIGEYPTNTTPITPETFQVQDESNVVLSQSNSSDKTEIQSMPVSVESVSPTDCKETAIPKNTVNGPIAQDKSSVYKANGKSDLEVIADIEKRFEDMYRFAFDHMLNAEDCKRAYNALLKNFDYSDLPLSAQIRLEQLCDEYKAKFDNPNPMVYIDSMSGSNFEQWCARLLLRSGFESADITPGSGDQGVDIVGVKDGVWYAVQCKRYASDLGNTPVQEVYAGKEMYGCQVAAVMTNSHFTPGAKELAAKTKVLLWDREKILEMVKNYGRV